MITNQPVLKYNPQSISTYTRHMPFYMYSENLLKDISCVRDPRTIDNDRGEVARFAYPTIGDIALCNVKPSHIKEIKGKVLGCNYHPLYTNRINNVIRRVFCHAVNRMLIDSNPFDRIWKPSRMPNQPNYYTTDELFEIMKAIEQSPLRNMLYLAIFTGMTSGELAGLTWDNIDFISNRITINKILKRTSTSKALYYETDRYQGFNRQIDVDPYVMDNFILDQFQHTNKTSPGSNVVFTRPGGLPFTIGGYGSTIMNNISHSTTIPRLSLRTIRSTFAIHECLNGENLALLRHQMGTARTSSVLSYQYIADHIKNTGP